MFLSQTLLAAVLLSASPVARRPAAAPGAAQASKLQARLIDAMACLSPANGVANIGVHAVQLSTGRTVFGLRENYAFTPASNTKLYSTGLALLQLGPDFRFVTRLAASREIDGKGIIDGDLSLVGGGDPAFASRTAARALGKPELLNAVDDLAESLVRKGLKRVTGSIVGDETLYPQELYPIGWTIDDAVEDYGAPVSALTVYDNVQALAVSPWRIGFTPPVEYFTVFNQVQVGDVSRVRVEKMSASRQLVLSGTLDADGVSTELVAVDQPALFAAQWLHEALAKRGVQIDGAPRVRSRRAGDAAAALRDQPQVTLAEMQSLPLVEILRVIDKVSQNLFAELVLRAIGLRATGQGTREAGLLQMYRAIAEAGAADGCCFFQDGSGLSRQNLVTPLATTRWLTHLWKSEQRDAFVSLLPVGGVDGSLTRRFAGEPEKGKRILGKTGTLAHISNLSGYIHSRTHGDLAYSILVNGYNGEGADLRAAIDKIAVALAE